MMKIKHKSLANKYPKSKVIYDVLSGGNKYRKPKFCEHNMIGYKYLSNVVDRQLIIINRLAKAVVSMEKKFTETKKSVMEITRNAAKHIDDADKAVIERDKVIGELAKKLQQKGGMQ